MKAMSKKPRRMALQQSDWLFQEIDGLPLVFSPLLSQFPQLKHAFSTRLGGRTKAPMDSFNVGRLLPSKACRADLLKNRARLCSSLSLDANTLVVPHMSHSNVVSFIEKYQEERPRADGLATRTAGLPILLTFADCVPIILFDPVKHIVAIIHAGWRGTASRIVQEGVKLLEQQGCSKTTMVAAIGPAIGSCCYPTGWEAVNQLFASLLDSESQSPLNTLPDPKSLMARIQDAEFQDLFFIKEEQFHPDLKSINAQQLIQAGVERIDITNLCTACKPELFYSHRQSSGKAGRQAAIACLN